VIIGYTFNADVYCADCMRDMAVMAVDSRLPLWAHHGSTEGVLDDWAATAGVDRGDAMTVTMGSGPRPAPPATNGGGTSRCGNTAGLSEELSFGDVVQAGDTALACDSIGFREIGGDLNKVRVSEPGTNPDPDA
jgi:hypothetical protein